MTLNNLGVLCGEANRTAEARRFYTRALGIFEKCLDENHPKIARCKENLAGLTIKAVRPKRPASGASSAATPMA
jgi:hypothetical protein